MDFMAALAAKKLAGGGAYALPSASRTLFTTADQSFLMGMALDASGNLWLAGFNGNGIRKYVGFSGTLDAVYDPTGDYRGACFYNGEMLVGEFDDKYVYRFNTTTGARSVFSTSHYRPEGVAVIGDTIYVAGYAGRLDLYYFGTSNDPYRGFLRSSLGIPSVGTYGARLAATPDGNLAICDSSGGFSIIDVSDVSNISVIHTLSLPVNTLGIMFHEGFMYSLASDGGIYKHDTV